jgi:uncharacterized protein (TIGR03437 family)
LPVRVWIQGVGAEVLYAGAAPGFVAGVMLVGIRLPQGLPAADKLNLVMMVGDWGPSPDGVTIAVR